MTELVGAYSATGAAWQAGPGRIYDRLAEVVVDWSAADLRGAHVLDVGAGTGAASRATLAAGAARVTAVDAAVGMLAVDARDRPTAAAAELLALPFSDVAFDAAVAAFSLNHVADPASGLREMARVTRSGGSLIASAYAADDTHPVKAAVEAALTTRGWRPDPWYVRLRHEIVCLLDGVDGAAGALRAAGLPGDVAHVRVPFPDLSPSELVAWRLGMAHHAPFVARLEPGERGRVVDDALDRMGSEVPPLTRAVILLRAVRP